MVTHSNGLAVVTGASTGIGLELARCCAKAGFSLLIAADEVEIHSAANALRSQGAVVEAVQADLATAEGVAQLYAAGVPAMLADLREPFGPYPLGHHAQ